MLFPLNSKSVMATTDVSWTDFQTTRLLPVGAHHGAFGAQRKHHFHEGVDLYGEPGEPVLAISAGVVHDIIPFTGPIVGSPWWHETHAIWMVHDDGNIVLYGEIEPNPTLKPGMKVGEGHSLGGLKTVLRKDKGLPMTMLHVELYSELPSGPVEWRPGDPKPSTLLDPTKLLLDAAGHHLIRPEHTSF